LCDEWIIFVWWMNHICVMNDKDFPWDLLKMNDSDYCEMNDKDFPWDLLKMNDEDYCEMNDKDFP
jgi:hypothetical protein